MNASRLRPAPAGDGDGAERSFSFLPRFSRFAWRLLRSKIISILSICRSGMAGSIGSDFTGVDGGGVWETVDALGRESERECERALDPPSTGAMAVSMSGDAVVKAQREFTSSVVRNWRIWSLCRNKSCLVSPIDCNTCEIGETGFWRAWSAIALRDKSTKFTTRAFAEEYTSESRSHPILGTHRSYKYYHPHATPKHTPSSVENSV